MKFYILGRLNINIFTSMRKMALHWQILLGMVLGVLAGIIAIQFSGETFILNWIDPFGTIFINLLKLIAVPLIIVSLLNGIADLKDISQLSRMGIRTIALYLCTTRSEERRVGKVCRV